nr:hypothetical protein [Acetobacter malorum]
MKRRPAYTIRHVSELPPALHQRRVDQHLTVGLIVLQEEPIVCPQTRQWRACCVLAEEGRHLPDQTLVLHRRTILRVLNGSNLTVYALHLSFGGLTMTALRRKNGRAEQKNRKANACGSGLVKA